MTRPADRTGPTSEPSGEPSGEQEHVFPPVGFELAPSAISGIEVYRPTRPETDTRASGRQFLLDRGRRFESGWGVSRTLCICRGCGARVSSDDASLTVACPFCGSTWTERIADTADHLRPSHLIPFTLSAEDCHRSVRDWLGSSWKSPSNVKLHARIEDAIGVFVPIWSFDAGVSAHWRADVAHTVREREYNSFTDEWESESHTEWRSESGRIVRHYRGRTVPACTSLDGTVLVQEQGYDLDGLGEYDSRFLAGSQAQHPDVGFEDSWAKARRDMREDARQGCKNDAGGRIRNLRLTLSFDEELWRLILVPIYVMAYEYVGERHQITVNGQTGAISGRRPVDWRRQLLVVVAALLPGLVGLLVAVWPFLSREPVSGLDVYVAISILLVGASVVLLIGTDLDG